MHLTNNTTGPRCAPGHFSRWLLAAAAALALAPLSSLAAAAAKDAPVRGLIVQLRDAPGHAELAREQALGAGQSAGKTGLAAREHGRWQGVIAQAQAASPMLTIAERHAVGASAQLWRFERPMSAAQARALAAQLTQAGEVLWAAPNTRERRLQPANPPSDPQFGNQWWLQPAGGSDLVSIGQRLRGVPGFQTAWTSVTTGSANSVVAVLDNGVVAHPDLAGKVIPGYDMVSDVDFSNDGDGRDADPTDPGDWVDGNDLTLKKYIDSQCAVEDSSWHGTAIAGMLAAGANNGEGGASINWPGKVLAVRVASKCGADVSDIVDGMRWAAGLQVCRTSSAAGVCTQFLPTNPNPARVINISFGGSGSCDAYQSTINELRGLNVVVVAAAGNEHISTPTRPAKCPGVIGVAALNRDGFKSTYSNIGSMLAVATVGGDDNAGAWSSLADRGVLSVGNTGRTSPGATGYFFYFGTSFSTPIVAGAAGLMLAVNPNLSAAQIEQGLKVSARPHVTSTLGGNVAECSDANPGRCLCTTSTCGAGILDVPQALAYAANPSGYVPPARQAEVNNSAELQAAAALGPDRPANPGTPPDPGGGNDGGGGGGAMSGLWLLALTAACLALGRRRRDAR
jgi:serine protease